MRRTLDEVTMNQDVEIEKYVLTFDNGDVYTANGIERFNELYCLRANTTYEYEFYAITKDGEKSEVYKG